METELETELETETRRDVLPLVGAVGVGAALAYFLDPDRGERRRHLLADQVIHATKVTGDAIGVTKRDIANRSRGVAAGVRGRLADRDDDDDIVITDRIRSALGRLISHPGAIEVEVENRRVVLSGPVLEDEADKLIEGVRKVRGVIDVESRLDRHETPGDVPALQGSPRLPAKKFELFQTNWTPATRFAATVAGGALATFALGRGERGNAMTTTLGLAGLVLLVRGATNKPFDRLLGLGAGRRAVTLQKAINVVAPVEEVFAWLTDWERWPEWMSHVQEVSARGERGVQGERTHWVVDGPAGTTVSWDAVTTRFVPQEVVAWKTVEGSPVAHSGVMRFSRNEDGSTRVDIQMSYNPVLGAAGHAVALALRRDPKQQLDDDLARLKTAIETGIPPHDAAAPRD
jgi:uncharacterized membrane protein